MDNLTFQYFDNTYKVGKLFCSTYVCIQVFIYGRFLNLKIIGSKDKGL